MNCKPDQRAVLTRTMGDKTAIPFIGMVFTVRTIKKVDPLRGPVWSVDRDNVSPVTTSYINKGDPICWVADAALTPCPTTRDPTSRKTHPFNNPPLSRHDKEKPNEQHPHRT